MMPPYLFTDISGIWSHNEMHNEIIWFSSISWNADGCKEKWGQLWYWRVGDKHKIHIWPCDLYELHKYSSRVIVPLRPNCGVCELGLRAVMPITMKTQNWNFGRMSPMSFTGNRIMFTYQFLNGRRSLESCLVCLACLRTAVWGSRVL